MLDSALPVAPSFFVESLFVFIAVNEAEDFLLMRISHYKPPMKGKKESCGYDKDGVLAVLHDMLTHIQWQHGDDKILILVCLFSCYSVLVLNCDS